MNSTLAMLNQYQGAPLEQWPHSLRSQIRAVSINGSGLVNSVTLGKARQYFHRKHEMVEGAFTGRSTFVQA